MRKKILVATAIAVVALLLLGEISSKVGAKKEYFC